MGGWQQRAWLVPKDGSLPGKEMAAPNACLHLLELAYLLEGQNSQLNKFPGMPG